MAKINLIVDKMSSWPAVRITAATGFIGFLAWLAATGPLYLLLSGMGLLVPINGMVGGEDSISTGLALSLVAAVRALQWVLSIGFMALGAIIYNACGGPVGGLKISLADDSQAVQFPANPGVTPIQWRRGRVGSEVLSAIWSRSNRNSYLAAAFN